jgi:hypothetical protein
MTSSLRIGCDNASNLFRFIPHNFDNTMLLKNISTFFTRIIDQQLIEYLTLNLPRDGGRMVVVLEKVKRP